MAYDLMLLTDISKLNIDNEILSQLGNIQYVFAPYENDIQFDSAGKLKLIDDVAKTAQSINNILLTPKGIHAEDAEYGTLLDQFIGEKNTYQTRLVITDEIVNALNYYNELNRDNENPNEYLDSIDSLEVGISDDPRMLIISFSINLESGEILNGVTTIL